MKKQIISSIVTAASFILKSRQIKVGKGPVNINLGCGMECREGWYNVDASPAALLGSRRFTFINKLLYKLSGTSANYTFEKFNDIVQKAGLYFYDLRRGIPFANNTADVIYHSHFLEHLTKEDAEMFLRECHRVLKKGGLMRITVPDLEFVLEMYKRGEGEKMLESYFFIPYYYNFSGHKYMYDFDILKRKLEKIGFSEIVKREYGMGDCPDANYLDVGTIESLYVECRK